MKRLILAFLIALTVIVSNNVQAHPKPVDPVLSSQNVIQIPEEQQNQLDSYMRLGFEYKQLAKYDLAEAAFSKAIALSQKEEDSEKNLFSQAELIDTQFLSGKISEKQRYTLTKEIKMAYENLSGNKGTRVACPAKCGRAGRPGYIIGGLYCISCS
jgi:tetratricopeptide (TPR) repeat protein